MRCTSFGERSNNINLKKKQIKITSFSLGHAYVLRDLIQTRTNNVTSRKTQICILHRRHTQFTYVWRENEHRKICLRWGGGNGERKSICCIMKSLFHVKMRWRRFALSNGKSLSPGDVIKPKMALIGEISRPVHFNQSPGWCNC